MAFDVPEMLSFVQSYYRGRADGALLAGGSYTVAECLVCGGVWQQEILDSVGLSRLYSDWICSEPGEERLSNRGLVLDNARQCARLLGAFAHRARPSALDYGMGRGEWCRMAQSFGFDVHGIELSPERLAYAGRFGVSCSAPDELPDGPFDLIRLEQVLEHLPDPAGTMHDLTSRLCPGGYVLIGVPDGSDVARDSRMPRRLLRKGPAQPLEHVNTFTPQSLRRFMHAFGCLPTRVREGLVRVSGPRYLCRDMLVTLARVLPMQIVPAKTRAIFRKTVA